jgi:hypothetical protein
VRRSLVPARRLYICTVHLFISSALAVVQPGEHAQARRDALRDSFFCSGAPRVLASHRLLRAAGGIPHPSCRSCPVHLRYIYLGQSQLLLRAGSTGRVYFGRRVDGKRVAVSLRRAVASVRVAAAALWWRRRTHGRRRIGHALSESRRRTRAHTHIIRRDTEAHTGDTQVHTPLCAALHAACVLTVRRSSESCARCRSTIPASIVDAHTTTRCARQRRRGSTMRRDLIRAGARAIARWRERGEGEGEAAKPPKLRLSP